MPGGAPPSQTAPAQASPPDIHVMPGKFRIGAGSGGSAEKQKGSKNLVIVIIVLGILLLGGGAFAAYTFFFSNSNTNTTTNSVTNLNKNANANSNNNANANVNANSNGNENTNSSTPTIVKANVTDPATSTVTATATLTIPAGALPATVKTVSITSLAPTIGAYATSPSYQAIGGVYLITPSGTKLSKKASMELTYTDQELLGLDFAVKEETVTAATWNGTDWVPMNNLLDTAKNIVSVEIDEFFTDGIALVVKKPTTTNSNSSINTNTSIVPTLDSDADSLTNQEEVIYGTNASNPDTDGDGFHDGQEVLARYNPNGTGLLTASASIKTYTNITYGFSILYPTTWALGTLNADRLAAFTSTTGEFVQVSVQDNPSGLSAREWYLSQSPSVAQTSLKDVATGTLAGILGPDGLNAYFADAHFIYQITYNIGVKNEANYLTTFTMMYSSLLTGLAPSPPNTNTNTTSAANTNTPTNS